MDADTFRALVEARAAAMAATPAPTPAEVFADARAFFGRIPEPPLYRRRDDPVRRQAAGLLEEGAVLLARSRRLGEAGAGYSLALEQHLAALCLLDEGRVEAAFDGWQQARAVERAATAVTRLWRRVEDTLPPVFDEVTGRSRFDERDEPMVEVTLACPWCQKPDTHSLSPRVATHALTCRFCRQAFSAYIAEVESLEVELRDGRRRRYVFRLSELSGTPTQVRFDQVGGDALEVAPRDLMAFLFAPPSTLRGVLNLNSSRVLWLPAGGPCFVATAVFGPEAPQLGPLRRLRDEVLLRHAAGQRFVAWYYREGPGLARVVVGRPWLQRLTRAALSAVVWGLERVQR